MERSEALTIFNFGSTSPDADDIQDAYESAIFELCSHFLKELPHALLVEGRRKKLRQLEMAYSVLTGVSSEPEQEISISEPASNSTLLDLVRWYEGALASRRALLANVRITADAMRVLSELQKIQEEWEARFFTFTRFTEEELESAPKSRQPDTVAMIKYLLSPQSEHLGAAESVHLPTPFLNEAARIKRLKKA